jgi:hypothetical protein
LQLVLNPGLVYDVEVADHLEQRRLDLFLERLVGAADLEQHQPRHVDRVAALDDVVSAVKDVVGRELSWETPEGTRTMDVDSWAALTARTEGTHAATAGTKAALQTGGYETWRWLAEGGACDENDDEVVEIGEEFSSGDTESPAHPGCRCPVIPNVVELTGDDNTDEQDDSADSEGDG